MKNEIKSKTKIPKTNLFKRKSSINSRDFDNSRAVYTAKDTAVMFGNLTFTNDSKL